MLKALATMTPRRIKNLASFLLPGVYDRIVRTGVAEGDMRAVSRVRTATGAVDPPPGDVLMPHEYYTAHVSELAACIDEHLASLDIEDWTTSTEDIETFRETLRTNPAMDLLGSTGYNAQLWLFMLIRALRARVVVESGVFVGASLWTIRRAAPDAQLWAFDVNLRKRKFEDPSIRYCEADWADTDVRAGSPGDICYFDDHVDNALRIVQAHARGFRHLVFDDCTTIASLVNYRYPGLPSALMLRDESLHDGQTFRWRRNDDVLEYCYREEEAEAAAKLLEDVVVFPPLRALTGRTDSHDLVYVRLR